MAHPARIAIIQHLVKAEHCICVDLVEELGLAQATISQHLKELKSIGIIKGCVKGTSVSYCINEKVWQHIKKELEGFFCCLQPERRLLLIFFDFNHRYITMK